MLPPTAVPPPLPPAVFSPVAERQRYPEIDVLRGFALFGVFWVNMSGFKAPVVVNLRVHEEFASLAAYHTMEVLAAGKFITLFALLFGLGMSMQSERAAALQTPFKGFFVRRMLVLLAIGIVHGIFLWAGDILALYSLLGLLGLRFLNKPPRALLKWAGAMWLLNLAATLSVWLLLHPSDERHEAGDAWFLETQPWIEIFGNGSWGEIIRARLFEWLAMWLVAPFIVAAYTFAAMLAGMAIAKSRWLQQAGSDPLVLRKLPKFTLPAGLVLSGLTIFFLRGSDDVDGWTLGMVLKHFAEPLLAMSYALVLLLMIRLGRWPRICEALASVGRLALTNYLVQSIVANILFMSWGFGLYGQVGAHTGTLIVVIVFTMQVAASSIWLRDFKIGPAEWVWRAIAYGSRPQLRRRS